jgi:hypothetical protein
MRPKDDSKENVFGSHSPLPRLVDSATSQISSSLLKNPLIQKFNGLIIYVLKIPTKNPQLGMKVIL